MSEQPPGQPRKTNRVRPGDGTPAQPGPQVVPSLEVMQAEFEALVKSNQQKFAELAARGASPDPLYMVHARINALIESIAGFAGPNGPRWAAMTRLTFERQIAAELAEAAPAVQRMQLAEGARYTPQMIRDLARQAGAVRRTH